MHQTSTKLKPNPTHRQKAKFSRRPRRGGGVGGGGVRCRGRTPPPHHDCRCCLRGVLGVP